MSVSSLPLYLPVRQASVDLVLDTGDETSIDQALHQLHWCELPPLLAIQHLPTLIKCEPTQCAVEQFLSKAFNLASNLGARESSDALIAEILKVFNLSELQQGLSLLERFSLRFMSLKEIERRSYLDVYGDWNYGFKERHLSQRRIGREIVEGSGVYLTDSQCRVISAVRADIDDHLRVEGYAGTGKSFQVCAILSVLESRGVDLRRVMILTHSYAQYLALKPRLPSEVRIAIFSWLATDLIPDDLTGHDFRHLKAKASNAGVSNTQYAQLLHLPSVAHLSPEDVARAAQDTVRNFCYTTDQKIDLQHIPKWTELARNTDYLTADKDAQTAAYGLVKHANTYWQLTVERPSKNLKLPVRGYQQIKFVALNKWGSLGGLFSHLLIDESHDLSPPMMQILDRINLPVISLGDRFQSLGTIIKPRPQTVRRSEICESVRAGSGLDGIVNPILFSHPAEAERLFVGDQSRRTEIRIYEQSEIPERDTAIFVSTQWGLFEWAQRLAVKGNHFRLLGSKDQLTQFAQDVIELFHRGIRPRNGLLLQNTSWEQVYKRFGGNQSFQNIHRLLDQGYELSDWQKTARMIVNYPSAPYVLSTLFNARNSEFNQVYLTPDMMDLAWSPEKKPVSKFATELYIGTTRVKNRLYVPTSMMHWIEEHRTPGILA